MTSWATRESVTDMRRSGGLPNRRVRFQAPFDDQLVERTPEPAMHVVLQETMYPRYLRIIINDMATESEGIYTCSDFEREE